MVLLVGWVLWFGGSPTVNWWSSKNGVLDSDSLVVVRRIEVVSEKRGMASGVWW
uniref:Uncharacterized protein n=1 Tax=Solanum tuberosum TaxID=4113 RepID=M1D6N7_SOLTU